MDDEKLDLLIRLKIEVIEFLTYNKSDLDQLVKIAEILGIDIPEGLQ